MAKKVGLPQLDLVVDIETVGVYAPYGKGMKTPNAIFNIGLVLSHKGQILLQEEICIEDIYYLPEHRILDFYRKNFTESDFTVGYDSFKQFLKNYFYPLLQSFNGQANIKLFSYNAEFDRRGFLDNAKLWGLEIPSVIQSNWSCLMSLSLQILDELYPTSYRNFCIMQEYKSLDNTFVTKKGNYKTSAEAVYRFISQQPSFVEAHKGMHDALIETEILQWIKSHKGWSKLCGKPTGGGWQIFNKNARPFQKMSEIQATEHDHLLLTQESQNALAEMYASGHIWRGED